MNDENPKICHGPCKQGRLPCPTPEACEMPDRPISLRNDFILAAFTVAVVLFVVWVLS